MKIGFSFLLIFIVCLAAFVVSDIRSARAAPPGVAEAIALSQAAPAVGPGFTESWAKTCTTTATVIVPAGSVPIVAFECSAPETGETDASQFVAIGDSGIGDPAFATRTSPIICGSGCAQTSKYINARQAYCRSDSDDVVLYCWGITTASVQP